MSQTLQNQILLAKSMNGIVTFDDGAGSTISNGIVTSNTLTSTTVNAGSLNTADLNLAGSVDIPAVNDIVTTYGNVSLQNAGNSYLANNVYLNGYLLPYFNLSTTSMRMGLNSMQYMTSATINTIAIGLNAMRGTVSGAFNQMPQSIVIGNNAFSTPAIAPTSVGISYNNVIIGDNGCKNNNNNKDCVIIGGQVCSSSNLYSSSNSIILGANIGTVANGFGAGYNDSVVIGSNVLLRPGLNQGIVIGANCFKNSTFDFANGPCVVGYNSASSVINFNRLTIFGNDSGKNVNVDAHNMILGPEAGNGIITNTYTTCIGGFSNASNGLVSATALGINCVVAQSHTLKAGGNDGGVGGLGFTRHQDLLIPLKNRLLSATIGGAVASLTPLAESGEYIFINSATTTSITLFTPLSATTSSQNISNFGTRFTIIRTVTGTSNITVNAPSGQFIIFNGVASSTYSFPSTESYVTFVCCNNGAANSTWAVESSQQILNGYVDLSTAQNISGVKTFLSAPVMSGASITANTIGQTQVNNGYLDLTTDQTITSGIKTFSTAPSNTAQTIAGSGTVTFSITGGSDILLVNVGITQLTLPVVGSGNVGQTFQISKFNTFTAPILIAPQVGSTLFVNNTSVSNTYIAITCNSFTVTATSTTSWVMYNNDNPEMTIQSKNIYPLTGNMTLASLANIGGITTISMGNGCLAACPSTYRTANSVAIGSGCLNKLTGNAQGMVCIGFNCMLNSTSNLIQNTTAIGSGAGATYAITGGGNTLIGASTDFIGAGAYNNSTAIGYAAKISDSNTIFLGTETEKVVINNQYDRMSSVIAVAAFGLTSGVLNRSFSIQAATGFPFTVTMPTIVSTNLGQEFIFRRTGGNTTVVVSFIGNGTQNVYNTSNVGGTTAQALMASGVYTVRLISGLLTSSTYAWFQI